jgi:2-polyprenyl-3-methyl-5-hydroxy-6-metoxy-1,4-benzoquinol methylase
MVFELPHTMVWQCTSPPCKLRFAHPQLSESQLASTYTELYYPPDENLNHASLENTSDDILRQVLQQMQTRFGSLEGRRLLDYGCGRGTLLKVAGEFGALSVGIESDPVARSIAAKQTSTQVFASLREMQSSQHDAEFDFITLWTVIEHLRTPWDELAQLRQLLRPGGWLLICTMDISCLRARWQREKWEQYTNPTHFYYFNPRSLGRAVLAAGFSELFQWRFPVHYPHHRGLRKWAYWVSFSVGLSDGLFFLCKRTSEPGATENQDTT